MLADDIAQLIPTIKHAAKAFHRIAIEDCGEPLVPLANYGVFAFESPHAYVQAGAPYGAQSPFVLRKTVADKLLAAHTALQAQKPGWKIRIFDGYRPVAVQAYMVAYTFIEIARAQGVDPMQVSGEEKEAILQKVYRIWSPPNQNPLTPPPHSTGAALDCTLEDEKGQVVDMGSPIDLNADISNPDYFATRDMALHARRRLLRDILEAQGFRIQPDEWWHFSYGDQSWVLHEQRAGRDIKAAMYGRV